ncbi:TPA: hypothetical protein MJA52_003933 [Klebsiella aerogenes]|nr:hypothetical protein [Klebsiella aerogenes]
MKKALVVSVLALALGLTSFVSMAADAVTTHEAAAKQHEMVAKHHKKVAKLHKEGKHEEAKKEASSTTEASKRAHEKTIAAEGETSKH